jgi:hypothetical protein
MQILHLSMMINNQFKKTGYFKKNLTFMILSEKSEF